MYGRQRVWILRNALRALSRRHGNLDRDLAEHWPHAGGRWWNQRDRFRARSRFEDIGGRIEGDGHADDDDDDGTIDNLEAFLGTSFS